MKLTGFKFSELGWDLNFTEFQSLNLLVGKNANGKSKTIMSLTKVAAVLSQRSALSSLPPMIAALTFEEDDVVYGYRYAWNGSIIIDESLTLLSQNGNDVVEKTIISRTDTSALFMDEIVNPPVASLLIHVRRDVSLYPEIEKILVWAETLASVRFNRLDFYGDLSQRSWILGEEHSLHAIVKELTNKSKQEFYKQAKSIGYNIEKVSTLDIVDFKKVLFKEEGIKLPLVDSGLSSGMFRSLSVLLYMNYFAQVKCPSALLIDDLCEGLDYARSTKLGKLIVDFCADHNIQLLITSNDAFLMDIIDLHNWNVLVRDEGVVDVINYASDPYLFDEFPFTGLSNFDFFASDYIETHRKKKETEV